MTKVTDRERIVEFLKGWAGNSGEMEELVQRIAEADGFEDIDLELINGAIKFSYKLNETGRRIADEWAAEWGCSPWKTEGEFWDEDRGSVESTAGDFGL
ncbi:MAG: hypothetical protein Q4A78_10020 [Peptostreptococcaceae bacterium]|nr:hypothetical protein [Peptostreptococcaceae bacterium]